MANMDLELETGVKKYSASIDGLKYFSVNGKLTNFQLKEFACHDGSDEVLVDSELIEKLQIIRDYFASPVTVNSGYRTYKYNIEVRGAKDSYHVKGKAADIVVRGVSPAKVADFARRIGFRGIGEYSSFTHVDTRDKFAYWHG